MTLLWPVAAPQRLHILGWHRVQQLYTHGHHGHLLALVTTIPNCLDVLFAWGPTFLDVGVGVVV